MSRATAALIGLVLWGSGAMASPRDRGDWHSVATDGDRDRLRRWRVAFVDALSGDPAAGAAIDPLLRPDAALPGGPPPPGAYRCRTIKLGRVPAPGAAAPSTVPCRITGEGSATQFAVLDGVQRPIGRLFPDGDLRLVFLGTMMLGDETAPLAYGRDDERNMIGSLERIGTDRWRLVLPYPRWESKLDLIEITPAG